MPEIPAEILNEWWSHVEQIMRSAGKFRELAEAGIYTPAEARFIQREADRFLYKPRLPYGGEQERKMVERFRRLARREGWSDSQRAEHAARQWSEVGGCYYKRRPLLPKRDPDAHPFYTQMRSRAAAQGDWNMHWFASEMLAGLPEIVSNFRMECKFRLRKADGNTDRLVRLSNNIGEQTKLVPIDAEAFSNPAKLRVWLNNQGGYVWNGGMGELADLQVDIAHESAWREVQQVVSCGWHALGGRTEPDAEFSPVKGIWFFGDCAYGASGELLPMDEFGIYWDGEMGYQLGDASRESKFLQNKPLLHPKMQIADAPLHLPEAHNANSEADYLREFFQETCWRLSEAIGGMEALLMLGSFFSFAAAPEIYEKFHSFPGLWVHGEAGSGKSTTVDWLMNIFGFSLGKGLDILKNVSAAGMQIAGEQYSNLPIWLDEFRNDEIEGDKLAILRSCYMRGGQAKWTSDGIQRELKSAFIVSGESTSSDAATRSRFPLVQIAASRRTGNHLDWFEQHAFYFFFFGRYLMQRRGEFSNICMRLIRDWCGNREMTGIAERDKLVHGVTCAALVSFARLIQSHTDQELAEFQEFMTGYVRRASEDVRTELNVNVWFDELLTAVKVGAVQPSRFRLESTSLPHPPDRPNQGPWERIDLFFDPNLVMAEMAAYRTRQHGKAPLKRKDLRDQLSKNPYWIAGEHSKRVGSAKIRAHCWGIDLDRHPLGYRPVSDEDYQNYLANPSEGDPRKGPLFEIVQKLKEEIGAPVQSKSDDWNT